MSEQDWIARLRQVRIIARQMAKRFPTLPLEDLEGAGYLGLMDAMKRHRQELSKSAYFEKRIRGAMLDFARQELPYSRTLAQIRRQVDDAAREMAAYSEEPPSQEALAEWTGISLRKVREALTELTVPAEEWMVSEMRSQEPSPEESAMVAELRAMAEQFPAREAAVIAYTLDGYSQAEIASILQVSADRISQIYAQAVTRFRRQLCPVAA